MRDGRTIVIDSLEGQVQLNAVRDFFGTGVQIQLEANPLMHEIFNIDNNHNESMQQLTELGYKANRTPDSSTLKTRSKARSKQQAEKAFYADGLIDTE